MFLNFFLNFHFVNTKHNQKNKKYSKIIFFSFKKVYKTTKTTAILWKISLRIKKFICLKK